MLRTAVLGNYFPFLTWISKYSSDIFLVLLGKALMLKLTKFLLQLFWLLNNGISWHFLAAEDFPAKV